MLPRATICNGFFLSLIYRFLAASFLVLAAEAEQRIVPAIGVKFPTTEGKFYQLEASTDFDSWEAVGSAFKSQGEPVEDWFPADSTDARFYRLVEVSEQWVLVWSDEFDGASIDRSKWQSDVNANGGGNNELQYYTDEPENSWVENGLLVIEARDEDYGGLDGSRNFTSARLNTKFRGAWTYGRIEVRARLPIGQGIWPAIWMLPQDDVYGTWAASGEIDIVETIGSEPSTIHGSLHFGGQWPNIQSSTGSKTLEEGSVQDDFHAYAIEWEEDEIRWYLDGELYRTANSWSSSAADFPAPFDQDFYLIVNLAVGGNWPGSPNNTTPFPARMEIDYARVYQWAE